MPDDDLNAQHPDQHHLLPAHATEEKETPRDSALAMRMLYDEQARLRAELDALKSKGKEDGDKEDGGGKQEGGEEKKEGGDGEDGDDKPKPEDPKAKRIKRARYIFLGVLALIPLTILMVWLLHYLGSYENTDDAFIDGHTDPISARINGTVANVFVENTYRVKKGQLLLQLDARDNQVAKEQAVANFAQAQAAVRAQAPQVPLTSNQQGTQVQNSQLDVVRYEAQLRQVEEQYQQALASEREAEANQANAIREEERYRRLVVKDEVSREQYDQRLTQSQAQTAQVTARRAQAEAARRSIAQTAAQLEQAKIQARQNREDLPRQIATQRENLNQRKASADDAKAQADQAELNLEYTRIYAPEDGIIGDKQVQVASRITAGQELFALTQTNDIWVTANFKETQVRKMRKGQTVKIHVDALGEDFDGYVEDLPGASGAVYSLLPPENATGNYVKVVQRLPVRIRFRPGQKDAERLAPGMSVEPKVWFR
ncbi:MAG: HlyD family secretion protein [Janthinobacterium lividum]